MTIEEWDAYIGGLSDEFMLAIDTKDEDGQVVAKALAANGWPGDSNRALRRLQRKYTIALKMLEAAEREGKSLFGPDSA